MTGGRNWTAREDARLREAAAARMSTKLIARELGRSHDAVRIRAKRIGVSLPRGGSGHQSLTLHLLQRVGPMRRTAIAQAIGVTISNAWSITAVMHQRGEIHVARWERPTSGPWAPVFAAGPGLDAPKPERADKRDVQRRYRERMRAEKPDEYRLRWKRQNAKRRKPRADVAAAWIGSAR